MSIEEEKVGGLLGEIFEVQLIIEWQDVGGDGYNSRSKDGEMMDSYGSITPQRCSQHVSWPAGRYRSSRGSPTVTLGHRKTIKRSKVSRH